MVRSHIVDTLAKALIGTAFFNFLVGAFLGGYMASVPALIPKIGPLHGEINPFGWLTMMIYGMTYAVLALSTGYRPPRAAVGWLHYGLAELGVAVIVVAQLGGSPAWLRVGLVLQAMAPFVFLGNLLSAVIVGKKKGRQFPQDTVRSSALALLQRSDVHQGADRVGQRGTDAALMVYMVAAVWMLASSFRTPDPQFEFPFSPAFFLVSYGWIGTTIWSVALHLLPRVTGSKPLLARFAALAQWLWWLAVLLQTVSLAWFPELSAFTVRLLGVAMTDQAVLLMLPLLHNWHTRVRNERQPVWSRAAWLGAFTFALVLGILLLLGLAPLSLLAIHLLFLGFATTLVYGVGYGLFPAFLGVRLTNQAYAWGQLALSGAGVIVMALAFAGASWSSLRSLPTGALLAIGGILAAIGAYAFILPWPLRLLRQRANNT